MARRDDDESDVPEGGKAAARLQQFLEARGLAPEGGGEEEEEEEGEKGDSEQAGQDTEHGGQTREDPDRDG